MAEVEIPSSEVGVLIQLDENKNISEHETETHVPSTYVLNSKPETVASTEELNPDETHLSISNTSPDTSANDLSKTIIENVQESSNVCLTDDIPLIVKSPFEGKQKTDFDSHDEENNVINNKSPFNSTNISLHHLENSNGVEMPEIFDPPSMENQDLDNMFKKNPPVINLIDMSQFELENQNCSEIPQMLEPTAVETHDFQFKEEEFHDAVQYFKDPSAFDFLKSAGNTSAADSVMTRCSLYRNFDPLHASQIDQMQDTVEGALQTVNGDSVEVKEESLSSGDFEEEHDKTVIDIDSFAGGDAENSAISQALNKTIVEVASDQLSDGTLISFDSPIKGRKQRESVVQVPKSPAKLYTEEEFMQALKCQEFKQQEILLRKQQECEKPVLMLSNSCKAWHEIALQLHEIVKHLIDEKKANDDLNEKQKNELKSTADDLQSVESAFADFHKRYENSKLLLKKYKQNEDIWKLQLEEMQGKLNEKEKLYDMLQMRTQSALDSANSEVGNARKTFEAQMAVLNAQLKKAELKISSLESDNKQLRDENTKLGAICDDLMAKVSNT